MLRTCLVSAAAAALTTVAPLAHALCAVAQPEVSTSTTANADGSTWHYEVFAQGHLSTCTVGVSESLTDYYLPYFADMGVANVVTAADWVFNLEATNDLFGLGGGVMHFSTASRPSFVSFLNLATSASFDAAFDGTKGPFLTRLQSPDTGAVRSVFGDPLVPASPLTVAALQAAAVPEPGAAWLLALGLVSLAGLAAGAPRQRKA